MPLPSKFLPVAIETADVAAKNLAKLLAKSKEKERMYHATRKDFNEFKPSHRGAYFATPETEFANAHVSIDDDTFKVGANVMPVYVNAENPFDYQKLQHLKNIFRRTKQEGVNLTPEWKRQILEGDWTALENEKVQRAIKNLGHDAFYVTETVGGEPVKNIGVFNPTQIKSAIGNRGTYNPLDPDITKAEGGQINPIKTPREMLLELANVPHMADGRRVIQAGDEMKRLIQDAIQKYIRIYKKNPPPEDVKALEAHVAAITQKPTIWTDPATQARARHELATNPGLMNPEDLRDPFITQAMVGRGVKGTRQAPFVTDINDPNLQRSLEMKQMSGKLEDLAGAEGIPSTTPAADALARMATGLEHGALSAGKVPLIDKLKLEFFKRNKRYPNEEELQTIVAEFNPLRHQYGPAGASIVQSRPPTAKGMAEWRAKARAEGVPEVYLGKPPADYPNYLQAELDIAKGIQPTVRQSSDDLIKNPNREYAAGHSVSPLSPADMAAEIAVSGKTPSKFEDPYEKAIREAKQKNIPVTGESHLDRLIRYSSMPGAAMAAHTAGQRLAQGDLGEAALHGTSALGLGLASTKKYLKPGLGIAGTAAVPLSIDEAISRYERGDRTGAVLSAIMALSNASQMHPVTAVPGAALGIGTAVVDAMRNKPEYRSVMEDYK